MLFHRRGFWVCCGSAVGYTTLRSSSLGFIPVIFCKILTELWFYSRSISRERIDTVWPNFVCASTLSDCYPSLFFSHWKKLRSGAIVRFSDKSIYYYDYYYYYLIQFYDPFRIISAHMRRTNKKVGRKR